MSSMSVCPGEQTLTNAVVAMMYGMEREVMSYVSHHADRIRSFVLAYRNDLRIGSIVQLPHLGTILYAIEHDDDTVLAATSAIGSGKLDDLSCAWRNSSL